MWSMQSLHSPLNKLVSVDKMCKHRSTVRLYCCIAPPASTTLRRVHNSSNPIFHQVWDISDRITVRKEVPAAGAVSIVVEP
jgi:hypothetical protein